ncbi:MAG: hypothetical protein GTN80_03215, partial [Nitrososphaeria archaeon]|nr:hypothetical protein [Nitrososphaeria archaeon]NIQ32643.1 hypothetical protein [Nitrososphaeria archaeon]
MSIEVTNVDPDGRSINLNEYCAVVFQGQGVNKQWYIIDSLLVSGSNNTSTVSPVPYDQ